MASRGVGRVPLQLGVDQLNLWRNEGADRRRSGCCLDGSLNRLSLSFVQSTTLFTKTTGDHFRTAYPFSQIRAINGLKR